MRKLIFIMSLLLACGGNSGDPGDEAPYLAPASTGFKTKAIPLPDSSCLNGSTLSYENFGAGIMSAYCLTCHSQNLGADRRFGAPQYLNFDSASDVRTWRVRILEVFRGKIVHNPRLGRNPEQTDKNMAIEWLECGAP